MSLCSEISFISWSCGIDVMCVDRCLEAKTTMSIARNLCSGLISHRVECECCSDTIIDHSIWSCEASNINFALCFFILFVTDISSVCCPGNPFVTQNGFM